jgi:hypothetical protein
MRGWFGRLFIHGLSIVILEAHFASRRWLSQFQSHHLPVLSTLRLTGPHPAKVYYEAVHCVVQVGRHWPLIGMVNFIHRRCMHMMLYTETRMTIATGNMEFPRTAW